MLPRYTILVTDRFMNVVGDPITVWTMIDVTLRFNEPSSGLFTVPGYDWIRDQFHPGCRVVVIRDDKVLIAGPVEKWFWERSDNGENAGAGTLTVNFADFLSLIVSRETYPDGTLAPSAQVIDNWSYTGNLETALRELVDRNAGPGALTGRQIPGLVLGAVAGVSATGTVKAERMEALGDVARRVAVAAGGIGFRTELVNMTQPEFQVYVPTNLANEVIFGFGAGSLKYIGYEVTAPTANAAIVGGQGEGADRFMIERLNAGSLDVWDRREVLVNRPGNDPLAELQAAGDEALTEGAETVRVPASVADTPGLGYPDYDIGSIVSVETGPGSMISDKVVTIHFQVYPTAGEIVSSTVGSQAQLSDPRWIRRMRAFDKRVSYLERNVVTAVVP